MNETITETNWSRVIMLFMAGVVAATQIGKVPPVLTTMRPDLGLDLIEAGWILSAIGIFGMLFGPIAGAVADRQGHRRMIVTGLILTGLSSLVGSLAQGFWLLVVTRVFESVGVLAVVVSAPSLILRSAAPGHLRLALGIWGGFMPAGMAAMMFVTPFLASLVGWRGSWQVLGLLMIGYGLFLAAMTRDLASVRTQGGQTGVLSNIMTTMTSPGPLLMAVSFCLYAMPWVALMGFLPTLYVEENGLSNATASVLTAVVVGLNALGNLLGGWLLQKGAKRWLTITLVSVILAFCIVGIYRPDWPFTARYILCLFYSLIGGVIPATLLNSVPVLSPRPDLIATTNGLAIQGGNTGTTIGPPLTALVVGWLGGWQAAPYLLAPAALVTALAGLALRRYETRS